MSRKLDPGAMSFIPLRQDTHIYMNQDKPFIPGMSKSSATKTMQKIYRGNKIRRDLTQKKQSASKIQSRLRGNRSRTGKSQQWGLPYPQSKRDLDFDPLLQKRIFEESMYGLREGLEPIKEDIDYQTNKLRDFEQILENIREEESNPNSKYNIGRDAHETKKERYLQVEIKRIKESMNKIKENPEIYRSGGLVELYKHLYGDGDEELIEEGLRDEFSKPSGHWLTDMGLMNEDPKLAKKEDAQQKYYTDMKQDKYMNLHNKEFAEYKKNFQEKKLEDLERLDLFKCKDIKAMAQADERLFLDPDFLENKIKPCRDELTKIYIDTYYSIPYEQICPNPLEIQEMTITNVLNNIHRDSSFTRATALAMKDTLITMGIMPTPERSNWLTTDIYNGLPTDNWYLLSQFYRWAKSGRKTTLKHTAPNPRYEYHNASRFPKYPIIRGVLVDKQRTRVEIDGREALEKTLNLFEDTVRERYLQMPGRTDMTDNDIEKMKRYFILCLIGFKFPWPDRVSDYIVKLQTDISRTNNTYWREMGTGDFKKADKIKLNLDKLKLIELNLEKHDM
jgi:hypothetical protein